MWHKEGGMAKKLLKPNAPRPRKDPWDPKDFSSSVPIESGVIYTKVTGPYTAKDRKLWPVLLHNAWQNDESLSQEHHIPISRIVHLFSEHGCDNSARWIWESARRLSKTHIEWVNIEHNKKKAVGFSVLLSSAVIEKNEINDLFTLSYTIPEPLCRLLKDPEQYGRIQTQLLLSLSSKYAVSLYEVLTTIVNRKKSELRMTLDQVRQIFKVEDDKLVKWSHLKMRALDPAVEELNSRAEHSGFKVAYELVRGPKSRIDAVIFKTEKTDDRALQEEALRGKAALQLSLFEPGSPRAKPDENFLRPLRDDEYRDWLKALNPGVDLYALEQEWLDWARTKPDFPPRDIQSAFAGFCHNKKTRKLLLG